MEKTAAGTATLLLMDVFSEESERLYTSLKQSGLKFQAVVLQDDGFLPEGILSVYGFFLGDYKHARNSLQKPRFFNQIPIPDYWRICGTNRQGQIYDMERERGRIFYVKPGNKRLVKTVDWLDESGVVRFSDHYNASGALWARTTFDSRGRRIMKTWFSADGREKIVENYVTDDIILNEEKGIRVFNNLTDFAVYALNQAGFGHHRIFFNTLSHALFVAERLEGDGKQNVLFWQEPKRQDIPGNMKMILEQGTGHVKTIFVQQRDSWEKLLELGADPERVKLLGNIYPFERKNHKRPEALICTNSDRMEHLKELVEALPQMQFHIAAITEMSPRLMAMEQYENVHLYPNIKMTQFSELFSLCDWYFDINYADEIGSAVKKAFINNLLVFGFQETLHNRFFTAPEHVYTKETAGKMIERVRELLAEPEKIEECLANQRLAAVAETPEKYREMLLPIISCHEKSHML